jgi:hypothetical protein
MPRYFFDIDGARADNDGLELLDMSAVRAEAVRAAGEMLRELDGTLPGGEWVMRISDESRRPVLTLQFFAIDHAQQLALLKRSI